MTAVFAKKTLEREWLSEVSNIPLQQSVIDLGIIDFATFDTGEKIKSPKPLKRRLKKLRKAQRKHARTTKGSKRRERARKRVAKVHAKISDERTRLFA